MDTIGQMPQAPTPVMGQNPMIAVHPPRSNSKNIFIIILLVVVVGLGLAWFGFFQQKGIHSELKTEAEQGKLVPGFLGALIITDDASILFSRKYDLEIAGKMVDSYITQYTTGALPQELMGRYLAYMKNNGFEVTKSTVDGGITKISGDRIIGRKGENLSITITAPQDGNTKTRVSAVFNNTK